MALDAAPAVEQLEIAKPGGGGPGGFVPIDGDRGGGGGGPDGEQSNGGLQRMAVLLAMVSITALFGAIALVYVSRARTPLLWRPVAVPKALWLSTAILLASSAWLEGARKALARRNATMYRERLLVTSFLGLAFLASQGAALYQLWEKGAYAAWNPHASLYYLLTGIHGLHLLGGLVAVNWLVLRGRNTWKREAMASGTVALYWHFMDVAWVGLFCLLLAL